MDPPSSDDSSSSSSSYESNDSIIDVLGMNRMDYSNNERNNQLNQSFQDFAPSCCVPTLSKIFALYPPSFFGTNNNSSEMRSSNRLLYTTAISLSSGMHHDNNFSDIDVQALRLSYLRILLSAIHLHQLSSSLHHENQDTDIDGDIDNSFTFSSEDIKQYIECMGQHLSSSNIFHLDSTFSYELKMLILSISINDRKIIRQTQQYQTRDQSDNLYYELNLSDVSSISYQEWTDWLLVHTDNNNDSDENVNDANANRTSTQEKLNSWLHHMNGISKHSNMYTALNEISHKIDGLIFLSKADNFLPLYSFQHTTNNIHDLMIEIHPLCELITQYNGRSFLHNDDDDDILQDFTFVQSRTWKGLYNNNDNYTEKPNNIPSKKKATNHRVDCMLVDSDDSDSDKEDQSIIKSEGQTLYYNKFSRLRKKKRSASTTRIKPQDCKKIKDSMGT